jgi:capsular polysaccharide biosynthesis protein
LIHSADEADIRCLDNREEAKIVEANDVMLRIFWRHRRLLVILVLVPMVVVIPLRLMQPVKYSATANIEATSTAPSADTQVLSILSQVTAVATSPQVVQKAINAAKVDRNALQVAKHEITATSLNSSAVVAVTVTDPNRQVAVRLGQSLANAVVVALNAIGTESNQQLATLTRQQNQLNANRTSLLNQLDQAHASNLATTDPHVEALITELAGVETQLSANEAAVQQVLATTKQDAGIISSPTSATTASKGVAVDAALAGLLGLVLGLLIATIHELVRPTLAEPAAGARELGVALLGDAELTEDELIDFDANLTTRLDLAASRLGARTLVLTGPVQSARLTQLATELDERLSAAADSRWPQTWLQPGGGAESTRFVPGESKKSNGSTTTVKVHALAVGSALSRLKVHALSDLTLRGRPQAPALIVVLPRFAPRSSLDEVADLGEATGWPILGVVGMRQKRKRRRLRSKPKASTVVTDIETTADSVSTPSTKVSVTKRVAEAQKAAAEKTTTSTNGVEPEKTDQQGYAR